MENIDSLRPNDEVTVSIRNSENDMVYQYKSAGFRSIGSAIESAISSANLDINPEDCVFEVENQTSGVIHKYRLNAHGRVKLIV